MEMLSASKRGCSQPRTPEGISRREATVSAGPALPTRSAGPPGWRWGRSPGHHSAAPRPQPRASPSAPGRTPSSAPFPRSCRRPAPQDQPGHFSLARPPATRRLTSPDRTALPEAPPDRKRAAEALPRHRAAAHKRSDCRVRWLPERGAAEQPCGSREGALGGALLRSGTVGFRKVQTGEADRGCSLHTYFLSSDFGPETSQGTEEIAVKTAQISLPAWSFPLESEPSGCAHTVPNSDGARRETQLGEGKGCSLKEGGRRQSAGRPSRSPGEEAVLRAPSWGWSSPGRAAAGADGHCQASARQAK